MDESNSNAGCDVVCIPCLLNQGERYQDTGDIRVFSSSARRVQG